MAEAWEIVEEYDEPEWDDEQRAQMLALEAYESGLCECGYHDSLTNDPANYFTFEVKVCPVCKASSRFGRMQDAEDEMFRKRLGDNPPANVPYPEDGRRTFIRPMSPFEVAARRSTHARAR